MYKNKQNYLFYSLLSIILSFSNLLGGLISPENGISINYIHVLFEWEQEPGAVYYEVQISESSNFMSNVVEVDNQTLVYLEKDALDWDKTYYWRIRPVYNNSMFGTWIDSYSFSTGSPLSEPTTIISNSSNIQNGITIFGAFFNYFSAAIDQTGKEIWNSGSENIVYYSTSQYGNVFGCTLVSGAENNLPGMEFAFDGEIIWEEPNDEFLHHDMIKLPNGNYLGIVEVGSLGPIPVGDWTPLFLGLGFQADGVSIEFPWIGDKLVEWDKNTKDVVWEWNVFDYFSMMDYDQYGGTWNQAYQDLHYDWTHINAVIFDEEESALFISSRHLSRITKIDYPSGNVIWNLGHQMASNDVEMGTDIGFSFQHSLQKLDNGNILTFDNGNLAPEFRGTDNPISRAIEISIDGNISELVWSYELQQELFGFASGNTQKLWNGNVLITTVGGGGRSLEVTPSGEIVWEVNYNLSLPNGAVYRANRVPGLYPAAFSVLINNFMESSNGGEGVYLPEGTSEIYFTLQNEGSYDLVLSIQLDDQAGWFDIQTDQIILSQNESEIISFVGNVSVTDIGNPITIRVTPTNHPEKQKVIVVNGYTSPLSNENGLTLNRFELMPAFPNPFNPSTSIQFNVKNLEFISLQIIDVSGRVVETLLDDIIEPGNHELTWNARNQPSGLYFVKLMSRETSQTQKLILLK
tara:strand:- start:2946 stop:5012 length:2067 start_codon:yes stop_codon:yes gene_type:complete